MGGIEDVFGGTVGFLSGAFVGALGFFATEELGLDGAAEPDPGLTTGLGVADFNICGFFLIVEVSVIIFL